MTRNLIRLIIGIAIIAKEGIELKCNIVNDEKIGEERIKTFHRHDGDFHIDYLFTKPELITSFELGSREKYVDCGEDYSDHVPLIFEVDL